MCLNVVYDINEATFVNFKLGDILYSRSRYGLVVGIGHQINDEPLCSIFNWGGAL